MGSWPVSYSNRPINSEPTNLEANSDGTRLLTRVVIWTTNLPLATLQCWPRTKKSPLKFWNPKYQHPLKKLSFNIFVCLKMLLNRGTGQKPPGQKPPDKSPPDKSPLTKSGISKILLMFWTFWYCRINTIQCICTLCVIYLHLLRNGSE